jgi:hypothetical protein
VPGVFGLLEQDGLADQLRFGQEADGTPAAPWGWEDLDLRLVPVRGGMLRRRSAERDTPRGQVSGPAAPPTAVSTETEEMNRTTPTPTVQVNSSTPS